MFPKTIFDFGGKTYTRGMLIRITTHAENTIEGRFLGLNEDNIICVITKTQISAEILDSILEIISIDEE
jgi:hypothetical protein